MSSTFLYFFLHPYFSFLPFFSHLLPFLSAFSFFLIKFTYFWGASPFSLISIFPSFLFTSPSFYFFFSSLSFSSLFFSPLLLFPFLSFHSFRFLLPSSLTLSFSTFFLDRQKDRQINRQIGGQADRHKNTDKQKGRDRHATDRLRNHTGIYR